MHMKIALVAGLAASAAAMTSGSISLESGTQQVGKVFEHEYIQPNVEEACFSVRPIASCDDQQVASYVKHQKHGFHCLNKQNPIAKQFQREADQGQQLPLENKSQDIQAFVEVPVRCERIDTTEKRLRKETEKTAEQKIHIIQGQDSEEDAFLFEHKPWTTEQDLQQELERQSSRHLARKNKYQKHYQSGSSPSFDESDDEDLLNEKTSTP